MVRAVVHRDAEVDHRVAGQVAARPRVLDAFFHRRHELARDRPAEDVVDELEVRAARQRLDLDLAVAELAVPAVEKGIQDSRMRGYLAGYPMVDFRATVFDGSFHQVDSNELSFKMAGSLAFKDAMTRARPTILEPIMNVEVYAPSDFAGDLMGDLNGRRGRISGMDTRGINTVIRAQVPMAEMLTYEQHLTSATGGRGTYHMEFSHYDEVPGHLHGKIISASKAERGEAKEEEE